MIIGRKDRQRVARLDTAETALAVVRVILTLADQRMFKGEDAGDYFSVLGQVIDLWESDAPPEAWRALLHALREGGVPEPEHDAASRAVADP